MSTTPKKLDIDGLAALFVTRRMAQGLPDEALKAALNAVIIWRGLQAEYDVYARHQNAVLIRPDEVAEHLAPGAWETLTPETRKKLRAAIREKERHHRQGLRLVRDFIHTQASYGNAGSNAFQRVYAEREAEYLTEPLPA